MTSKNEITLYNNRYGNHKLSIQNAEEVFNRENMTNNLLMIEGKEYEYNDIKSIYVVNLVLSVIDDLPHNLEILYIKRTTLFSLAVPHECIHLRNIEISDSNLSSVPEIDFLPNLQSITFQNSAIRQIPLTFPSSLQYINLTGNLLDELNTEIRRFPKHCTINLFKNGFTEKEQVEGYNILYGTQYLTPSCTVITSYCLEKNNAYSIIEETIQAQRYNPDNLNIVYRRTFDHDYFNRELPPQRIPTPTQPKTKYNIFNSSQTVHISSICNSITKSLLKINELTEPIYKLTTKDVLIDELIDEFYTKKSKNIFERAYHYLKSPILNAAMVNYVKRWVEITDVHMKTQISYGELLAKVWILIKNHQQKQDFITNVKIELKGSIGVCFTGRFNRLVNSLIGFVDGITVGISIQEQLQLEIGNLIAKLGKKEISYDECFKTIDKLFDDPDVKEDETITEAYKMSWLDALEDYKPELEKQEVIQLQEVKNPNEEEENPNNNEENDEFHYEENIAFIEENNYFYYNNEDDEINLENQ